MSDPFSQLSASITVTGLSRRLRQGAQGAWEIEGLGPLEVRGECRVGRLLMTHGAGAGQDSTFLQHLRDALAATGVQTLAIEFDYLRRMRETGRRRPPPRIDHLVTELAQWCDSMSHPDLPPLWLGGKSMGGRVASLLAAREGAPGLVLCGYPFHPPRKPDTLRLDHWSALRCPTLVIQGSRDPLGTREEVTGYPLPACAEVHWLADGDHDWRPRRASGNDQAELIRQGADAIAAFMARYR